MLTKEREEYFRELIQHDVHFNCTSIEIEELLKEIDRLRGDLKISRIWEPQWIEKLEIATKALEQIERLAYLAPKRGASAPDLNAIYNSSSQALKEICGELRVMQVNPVKREGGG